MKKPSGRRVGRTAGRHSHRLDSSTDRDSRLDASGRFPDSRRNAPAGGHFKTLLRRTSFDILTGSIGPKVSLRALLGNSGIALEADTEYSFLAGAARGWMKEFSVGAGYQFTTNNPGSVGSFFPKEKGLIWES